MILSGLGAFLTAAPAAAADIGALWKEAFDKARQDDCGASLTATKAVMREKQFALMNDLARSTLYQLAVSCAYQVKDRSAAYRYALEGTRTGPAHAMLWQARFGLEVENDRPADAVGTIEAMASRNPEALNGFRMRWFFSLYRTLKDQSDPALRTRFLTVMTAPGYQPSEPLATGDFFKRERATLFIDAGDRSAATALVQRITEPRILMSMEFDPRLRVLLASDFDERAAVESRLARVREIAASHTNSLATVLELSRYQRMLGRSEEALATLEAARPDGPDGKQFTDLDEETNWWWDEMARSYQTLGRYDEAVSAFGHGIVAKEDGSPNVSQTINLGHAHVRFGHPERALKTVAVFETASYSASPYGEMEMRLVRGCAQAALGNRTALEKDVAYARDHERDHPEALTDLLLCADDMDSAAASMIRRLNDPDKRAGALSQLSIFDPPPPSYPLMPFEKKMVALKERADVQAAIERAGGVRHIRLQAGEL